MKWEFESMKSQNNLRNQVRLAHQAMMLNDAQSVLRNDRDSVLHHQNQQALKHANFSPPGDDMIQIGDSTTHIHHHPSKQRWAKTLLGIGLLATGIGGPLGAWLLADQFTSKPKSQPHTPATQNTGPFTDNDSVTIFELPDPKAK